MNAVHTRKLIHAAFMCAVILPCVPPCVPRAALAAALLQPQAGPIERSAKQPPDQLPAVPTLHVESRLVTVALNVVDAQGAPVQGLTANDFELTEDGRPLPIAVFDKESATPLQIVLAVDASASVFVDERLEQEAARSFVHSLLRTQDRIELIAFSDTVEEIVPFTGDSTDDFKSIDRGLERIRHGEATALYDAVDFASQQLAGLSSVNEARHVIVLISDGENTTRHGSYDTAVEQAERAGAMIYSLILVPIRSDAGRDTGGEHALIQMSQDTGGTFYYVEGKSDLATAFAHVSSDLRTQYTLGYYAPQRGGGEGVEQRNDRGVAPSGLRRIHLQLKDPALRARYTLRYRSSYYADR